MTQFPNPLPENQNNNIKSATAILEFFQSTLIPFFTAIANAQSNTTSLTNTKPGVVASTEIFETNPQGNSTHSIQIADAGLEKEVVDLYTKGLNTRDIVNHLKDTHGIEIPTCSVSAITDKVLPGMREWQTRPLSSQYPILYMDGLWFKVKDSGKIISKCAYIALGINIYGYKEVLGIWISENEGAKFWLQILTEVKNRGVESVLIACVDGLRGFPEAIKTVYPESVIQVCIVHQVRHTIKFVSYKDRKKFATDLKDIYCAPNEEAGVEVLKGLLEKWPQYNFCLKRWEERWNDIAPFFSYPEAIRRIIYTTNTIENLNRQFRKVTKTTIIFPHDDALMKLLWLVQYDVSRRWSSTIHNWGNIISQLAILFPDKVKLED